MECTVKNCNSKILAKGLCSRHYKQMRRCGEILIDKPKIIGCSVKGCDNKHYAKGFCSRHYKQWTIHGKILTNTKYDKNEIFIVNNSFALIYLYNMSRDKIAETKIDIEDISKCENIRWYLSGKGYVTSSKGYLHHYVTGIEKRKDHHDRDPLNNQKHNLRTATSQQNSMNRKLSSNNTTGYNGVCYSKQKKKFTAQIRFKDKLIYLGSFVSSKDAATAYNIKAIELSGEFANLNKVE